MNKKVFLTMISFNNNEATFDCLRSIEKATKKNIDLSVVVVDNASKDKFYLREKFSNLKLKIIRNEENLGFSGGHNLAIKYALREKADYVMVLNNDTLLEENLVSNLIDTFREDTGVVSPKIYFAKGFEFHKDKYDDKEKGNVLWFAGGIMDWANIIAKHRGVDEVDNGKYNTSKEVDFVSGCCMLIKREIFEKIGLFDEEYFLYYEDNDFSQRVRKAGFKILYQPSGILWHKNAVSAGGSGSELQDYYITRNRLLFGFKFAKIRQRLSLLRESFKLLTAGRKWQKRGVLDFYLRNFGKGSYPV